MVRQIAPFGNVVQPGCSEWGSFTGFLILILSYVASPQCRTIFQVSHSVSASSAPYRLSDALTGGVPEAVLDGRTGLVAPQGDLNQMAAHCERLIQDGKLLQTLAEEGRRHAEQTFSYPVIAARHAALYEETLREYRYEE